MTDHTPQAGDLPNAAIDFNKAHQNALAGRKDIFATAVEKDVPNSLHRSEDTAEGRLAKASRDVAAREAGFATAEDLDAAFDPNSKVVPVTFDPDADARTAPAHSAPKKGDDK